MTRASSANVSLNCNQLVTPTYTSYCLHSKLILYDFGSICWEHSCISSISPCTLKNRIVYSFSCKIMREEQDLEVELMYLNSL
ncbi:hypothetical protein F0562_005917 [Nyssa sinensis]|uniref:Uncharacterized protein n=1 Tax=Nyssa sinensis TaxID=561372 RepID=A0A5J5ALU9_9ASTE|nr:hypothetical protein F0562_005917 [Nyssa sinensis]